MRVVLKPIIHHSIELLTYQAGSTDSLVSIWDLDNPQRYLGIHQ